MHFPVPAPGFFRFATFLFYDILGVEPALQVAAAELPLFVLLVAGALAGLFDLDLVMWKLRRSLCARSCHFARRQSTYLIRAAPAPPESALRASLYLKRFAGARSGMDRGHRE